MNIRVSEYFHLINNTLYISEETPVEYITNACYHSRF